MSYKKYMATAATTALVVSAVAPAAMAAGFTDVSAKYQDAVDFVVSKGASGISKTEFGVYENIKRVDAAVLLANVLGLDLDNAKPSGFTDVPKRAVKHVNALKEAGITSGKTATTFDSHSLITRGELAMWIQKGFELTSDKKSPFTDVPTKYQKAVSALVGNGITSGVSKKEFGTYQNAKRGDYAIFLMRAFEVSAKTDYKVEGVKSELLVKDDASTTDVNETTMKFVVKAVDHKGSTEIVKNPTVIVKDKDGNEVKGKAKVNASTGEVTITGTLEDVKKGPFTLEVKVEDLTVLSTTYKVTDNRQAPAYEVKSNEIVLTSTDGSVLNTLFDGTVLDFGSSDVTVTDVDFVSDNKELIADNDAVKEGTVAISTKYNGQTSIYVDTVTVNVNATNETFELDLNDLQVNVTLKAQDSTYNTVAKVEQMDDYVSVTTQFQNSLDQEVDGFEVALLDKDGNVIAKNTATQRGLNHANNARKNNSALGTTLFETGYNHVQESWTEVRADREDLAKGAEVRVTFTANGASYTTSQVYRQAPAYEVKSNEIELTSTDETALNTLFDGTVLDFGSTDVTVTDVDFASDNEDLIADNDAVKAGTAAISTKYNGQTSIYVDTVTVKVKNTTGAFVLDLNDLKVDVSLKAQDSKYNKVTNVEKMVDYISITTQFQNSFDKTIDGFEVALLDKDGNVIAKNTATKKGLLVANVARIANNALGTTLFETGYDHVQESWTENRADREELAKAVKVQVTFTSKGASYTTTAEVK